MRAVDSVLSEIFDRNSEISSQEMAVVNDMMAQADQPVVESSCTKMDENSKSKHMSSSNSNSDLSNR